MRARWDAFSDKWGNRFPLLFGLSLYGAVVLLVVVLILGFQAGQKWTWCTTGWSWVKGDGYVDYEGPRSYPSYVRKMCANVGVDRIWWDRGVQGRREFNKSP